MISQRTTTLPLSARLVRTFIALRYPNYRLWFAGQLLSLIGTWTQNAAQGYLVFQITGSPAFLGYTSFAAGAPSWIFTLFAGAIADRMPRRTVLVVVQSAMMVVAAITAALVFTDAIQPWHILVLAFLSGTANAFDAPVRHSFVAELVDRKDLSNAISLNALLFNSAVVLGPALGGVIYAVFGPGWCFTINSISFLAIIVALLLMSLAPAPPRAARSAMLAEVGEGLRYVAQNPTLRNLILGVGFFSLFGFGVMTIAPAWAVDILKGDVTTNGLLLSARGIGSIGGALLVASFSQRGGKGRLWLNGALVSPLVLIVFSQTHMLEVSLVLMVIFGFGQMIFLNTTNALVQEQVSNELRGRVMGLYSLVLFGGMPLGSLLVGNLAEWFSEPLAVFVCAIALLIYSLVIRRVCKNVAELE